MPFAMVLCSRGRKTDGIATRSEDGPITLQADINPHGVSNQPRARGTVHLSTKRAAVGTVLDRFRQTGSLKCLFPGRRGSTMDAVLLNTAGGVTGGDQFDFSAQAAPGTTLTLTTQACERAYKAQPGEIGKITNRLRVDAGARINWLPQETILFNGSTLHRQLKVDLSKGASLLMVEPLVFGRPAMGEDVTDLRFRDRIEIRRDGVPLFIDAMALTGNARDHLAKPFIADGAGAMALVLLIANNAEAHLSDLQETLPATGGVSLLQKDVLVMRLLAEDSFALRHTLLPALQRLNGAPLPRCWKI
jgi:urease accessory protein